MMVDPPDGLCQAGETTIPSQIGVFSETKVDHSIRIYAVELGHSTGETPTGTTETVALAQVESFVG